MTDYYDIAMGLKKPKTIQDDIKIEKKGSSNNKKQFNLLKKIRNKKLRLVENNLMIDNKNDNNNPKLIDGSSQVPILIDQSAQIPKLSKFN